MSYLWRPMPYKAIRKSELLKIGANDVATGISAFKVFLIICCKSEMDKELGMVARLTYSDFESMCNMSRAMISKGVKKLEEAGVVSRLGGHKNKYQLLTLSRKGEETPFSIGSGGWCKIPIKPFTDDGDIQLFEGISNRGVKDLDALKLFVYLLSVRSKGEAFVRVGINKICLATNLSERRLIAALNHMRSLGLVFFMRFLVGNVPYPSFDLLFLDGGLACSPKVEILFSGWEYLEWSKTDDSSSAIRYVQREILNV
ncbi:MAG: hypothetical protein ACRCYD_05295 [Plesiomonas sp.]|uniref:hypothetical protein n=1 Tax=Plesiomonas shigelloides TaxID=703 RepID=UPI001C5B4518|nr:hypothetical protein [Plesiomonas shigelloides]MBW3794621.1 hypothetical protein [Plesiomonas shigelloides]